MIEGHGDDAWQYKTTIRADFSSNVWHGPLDPGLQAHLQSRIATVTRYPDPAAQNLQELAATAYGLRPEQVLVTNGATEGIYLIAQTFRNRSATVLTPSFSEYEDACRLHGLDTRLQSWDTVTPASRFPDDGLVFLCNPNNPTGSALPPDHLRQLLSGNPHTLFVIDESYIEFTRATGSIVPGLAAFPNALVLRSLTKSCRIPGLRIGFVFGHSHHISNLRQHKMPWSVNRLAIEAAGYIFCHRQRFFVSLEQLLTDTAAWRNQLRAATGWRVHDTHTHYFLVEITAPPIATGPPPIAAGLLPTPIAAGPPPPFTAAALKRQLVKEHGLLIRDAANFKGLTPYHFRVACQTPAHNQLLTEALSQCIRTGL